MFIFKRRLRYRWRRCWLNSPLTIERIRYHPLDYFVSQAQAQAGEVVLKSSTRWLQSVKTDEWGIPGTWLDRHQTKYSNLNHGFHFYGEESCVLKFDDYCLKKHRNDSVSKAQVYSAALFLLFRNKKFPCLIRCKSAGLFSAVAWWILELFLQYVN